MSETEQVGKDWKTIGELATELKVTRQQIYAKLQEKGIDLDGLPSQKQGNRKYYAPEAVTTIMETCKKRTSNASKSEGKGKDETRAELKAKVAILTKQLEEANAEVARLRDVETELRHTVSSLTETLRIVTLTNNMKMLKAAGVGTSGTSDTNTDTNEGGNGLFARIKSKVAGLWR